ncbi:uncharacterized protein LY89DRAFT_589777 [Mollisia scopiformis]|uniref:Pre-mRNA-splicing factor 38B n=1 Tax=Mollisia scopiformis TaxID=149040 RepID=A0A194X2Z9_MOLSC|nr:uncharacterized protein LY89DRAFT_589777 [Mollisia scopiformis]KUJ14394.1 hypothetical protein LY89DRAFT_589777 [Mollisia scopiformis]
MADEELTDDYVAKLLAKDAKESSIKYSAMGLQAFAPSKPPANKPKPNTRFLRNIIKDTDNHNAALLAKEAAEARARLRNLPSHQQESKKPVKVGAGDIRRRQLGDIAAILGGRPSKRKRTEASKRGDGSRYVNTSSEDEVPKEKSREKGRRDRDGREDRDEEKGSRDHRSRHRRHRSLSDERGRDRKERRKRDRSSSRSPRQYRETDSRRRERSPRRKRSSSPDEDRERERSHRSYRHRRSTSRERRRTDKTPAKSEKHPVSKPDYDSDPLDDIIGPRPPEIKIRGRGTISLGSGIDDRFSSNYDPTTDVQLDPDEENDWDQALEALKDRQKWQQQGADRLRAAGFTEEEVSKWEKGGEKREADVKWAKQGEGREWDRGKVLGDDGMVKVESSFGRLTSM